MLKVWRRKRNEEGLEEHMKRKRVVKRKLRESRKNGPKVWVRIVKIKITKFGLGVNEVRKEESVMVSSVRN